MPIGGRSVNGIRPTQEFLLVVVMLIALVILVYIVLMLPANTNQNNMDPSEILNYRKDNLAVILTAFGAWISAGAAYFFGRESLKQTSDNILAMREYSPKEMLRKSTLRDISLPRLDWTVKASENLGSVREKLNADSKRWFVPILREEGTLEKIIHEEVFWRFIDEQYEKGVPYEEIRNKKVSDVLAYINSKPNQFREGLVDNYVTVRMENSAWDANDLMRKRGAYMAIVLDDRGKPTHYLTPDDIRRLLMKVN